LDIDPDVVRWGAPQRHITASIEQATSHFSAAMFDTVVLSGVFGFGVNEIAGQEAAIAACAVILKPGGLLVLGWNSDLVADPSMLTEVRRNFDSPSDPELDGRVTFRRSTHVFDFHTRRAWARVVAFLWVALQPVSELLVS
jgi:SAM-dependent methyltransferase